MSAPGERSPLDEALLSWMRETPWTRDEERFRDLALAVFEFQFEHCPAYARFCQARGVSPKAIDTWEEIPPVPTGSFKEVRLACFPEAQTQKVFRTSGTSNEKRGELHLDRLDLYEASLEASLRHSVFPDLGHGERMTLRTLAPDIREAPDSSLSHMFQRAVEVFGDSSSGFDVLEGQLQVESLFAALDEACRTRAPVALCGTTFAFVHLLDALEKRDRPHFDLPPGSRVMETGGYKGRSREVPRKDLVAQIGEGLGIAPSRVLNQYGMTELGSQFYDSRFRQPEHPVRKVAPPWTRVRLVDPSSGRDCAEGEPGMIVILDLANVGSVSAIETADLGRRVEDGFEVLGRQAGAEERGCSIATDIMLGAAEPS